MDLDGRVLGRHRALHTIRWARERAEPFHGTPCFVVEIRPETNEVVIGDNEDVFTNVLRCDKLNWMAVDGLHGKPMDVIAKIRYSHRGSPCTIREIGMIWWNAVSMSRSGL